MSDEERQLLAGKMQEVYVRRRNELYARGVPSSGSLEDACMLAALAVAEPVVREQCAALADAMANELDATGEAMHKQGIPPTGMLGRGVYQLRAMSVRDVATDIRTGGTP